MIQEAIDVDLPRPRDLDAPGYLEKRDRIFRITLAFVTGLKMPGDLARICQKRK